MSEPKPYPLEEFKLFLETSEFNDVKELGVIKKIIVEKYTIKRMWSDGILREIIPT